MRGALRVRRKKGEIEGTCDGTRANHHATHVVFELLAEIQQRVARERLLRDGRAASEAKKRKSDCCSRTNGSESSSSSMRISRFQVKISPLSCVLGPLLDERPAWTRAAR